MRIVMAAVGRARSGPEKTLFDHYVRRLTPAPVLREVEEKRPLPAAERKDREAELLLAALPVGATVVALDGGGKELSSEDLATKLGAWRDHGVADLAFLIGGADGHGPQVLRRAVFTLSLGRMTWPHMLVRGMLAEQLYRAHSILAGHPYHRA